MTTTTAPTSPHPDEYARQLDAGWPQLYHHLDCDVCKNVRKPVAYEALGSDTPPTAEQYWLREYMKGLDD
jgi:hypothetical protein